LDSDSLLWIVQKADCNSTQDPEYRGLLWGFKIKIYKPLDPARQCVQQALGWVPLKVAQ